MRDVDRPDGRVGPGPGALPGGGTDAAPVDGAVAQPVDAASTTPAPTTWGRVVDRVGVPGWTLRAVVAAVAVWWAAQALVTAVVRTSDLLITVVVAFIIACALEPPVNALVRRGWRRGLATFSMMAVTVLVLGGVTAAAAFLVAGSASSVFDDLPRIAADGATAVNNLVGTSIDPDRVAESARRYSADTDVSSTIGGALGQASRPGAMALTSLLFVFYLVADGPRLRHWVCSLLRPSTQAEVLRAWELAISKAGGWMASRALLTAITAVAAAVAFSVIGVPYAVPVAVCAAVATHFIPVVGSWIAVGIAVVPALSVSPGKALAVVVFLVVFNQVRNMLIAPRVVRHTLAVHPAVGFFATIAAGFVLGPVGALMALPVVATVQSFLSAYVHRHDVVDSHLVAPQPK